MSGRCSNLRIQSGASCRTRIRPLQERVSVAGQTVKCGCVSTCDQCSASVLSGKDGRVAEDGKKITTQQVPGGQYSQNHSEAIRPKQAESHRPASWDRLSGW